VTSQTTPATIAVNPDTGPQSAPSAPVSSLPDVTRDVVDAFKVVPAEVAVVDALAVEVVDAEVVAVEGDLTLP
jgi:hypothetical protein